MAYSPNADILYQFMKSFSSAKSDYKKYAELDILKENLCKIATLYRDYFGIGDLFVSYGESLIDEGDYAGGISVIRIAYDHFTQIANQTTTLIRLAECAFCAGNNEEGKTFLLTLCNKVDNYEESIKLNKLYEVWERYKPFIANELLGLANSKIQKPLSPEECTYSIDQISKSPKNEILELLSEHLNELSAGGKYLDLLSREEFYLFLADEFIEHINSDGIEHYLSCCSTHFPLLSDVFREIGADEALILLEMIKETIPNTTAKIEDAVMDIDFEKEEDFYYKKVEKRLLKQMCTYFLKNKENFK